nr:YheC/YheD family protein [Paenibacillus puerhi]
MQKPASKWLVSGEVVRVGAAGRFVTNYHNGGKPAYLKSVLHSIYKNQPNKVNRMIRDIEKISMISSKELNRKFPKNHQWGVDIALDKNGRLWIIESNASPAFLTFKHLKDKTMYNRILRRKHHIRSKYSRG